MLTWAGIRLLKMWCERDLDATLNSASSDITRILMGGGTHPTNQTDCIEWACHSERACMASALIGWMC